LTTFGLFGIILGLALLPTAIFAQVPHLHWESNQPFYGEQAQQESPDGFTLYLPGLRGPELALRIGYGATRTPLQRYNALGTLWAGWWLDWSATLAPERPHDMEYVQVVRVHQKLACEVWHHSDRQACPYAEPYDYLYSPDQATIQAIAQANPGALWLIGNEIDRKDWAYCADWDGTFCKTVAYSGQDEILPSTYATAYHDLYTLIKAADVTALVANAGVIQATPLRLKYLTQIWDSYWAQYGGPMPVDVWNVHNFILQEKARDWGAEIPPGLTEETGEYLDDTTTHLDLAIFGQQIRAFRQWMKDHDQQAKPLIVSEYGVLFSNGVMGLREDDPKPVQNFMTGSFDYFLDTQDCTLGFVQDECRLVQRWVWYSLDDKTGGFNPFGRLFDPDSTEISETGQVFRDYILRRAYNLAKRGYQ
jgi:hypothetical protein